MRSAMKGLAVLWMVPVVFVVLGLVGCGSGGGKDDEVQVMTEAAATEQVKQLADQVAQAVGAPELANPKSNSAACENRVNDDSGHVRYVQGTYNLSVANDKQVEVFSRVRDQWQKQGWAVSDFRVTEATRKGSVSMKDPDKGVTFTLTSSKQPDLLALLVHSGCYRDADRR